MRIPIASNLESRDGTVDQDAKVLNGIIEADGESLAVRKRPGNYQIVLGKAGIAQALISWNGLRTVQADYLNSGTLSSIPTHTALSPAIASLPFSYQSSASSVASPKLMIKNRTQAWTIDRAGTATAVTYGGTMGSYTYSVVSIARVSTVAVVSTLDDTGLNVGDTVTISGAGEAEYNGAQTVTGVVIGSYTPAVEIPITITRSGTTATATTVSGDPHGLTTATSYAVSGATEGYYNGSYTITTSGGSTFTYTVTTTAPAAITGTWNPADKAAVVTLSGSNLIASCSPAFDNYGLVRGTVSKAAGVWAFEITVGTITQGSYIGIATSGQSLTVSPGSTSTAWVYRHDGYLFFNSTYIQCASYAGGSKIGVVFDGDANTISFYKNGVFQGSFSGVTGTVYPLVGSHAGFGGAQVFTANFAGSFTYSYDQPVTPAAGTIIVTDPSVTVVPAITYTVAGSPATPATGTITAAVVGGTVPGIAYINGYFCVMDTTGIIWNSDGDDPTTWGALNFIAAENEPGAGVAIAKTQNFVVAFKQWSSEFFYDAQNPTGSPLSPVPNGFTQVGCASGDSVATIDDALLFISQSRQAGRGVYLMVGTQQQKVSTPSIDRVLNADTLATVYAYCVKLDGHPLYVLTLVASNITIVYDLDSKMWTQWSSLTFGASVSVSSIILSGTTATVTTATAHGLSDGSAVYISGADQTGYNSFFNVSYISSTEFSIEVDSATASPATGTVLMYPFTEGYFKYTKYANHLGHDLLLHESTGYVNKFLPTWYMDYAEPINFFVRTGRLDGGAYEAKLMGSLTLVGQTVAGAVFPSNQSLMVRWSDDDSTSFSKYRNIDMRRLVPMLRRCGAFKRRSIEVKTCDNSGVRLSALEMEIGG